MKVSGQLRPQSGRYTNWMWDPQSVWQQFGHGPCWLPRTVPAIAWKRKAVQRPGDLRSGVACSTALQRHCRARLQGLLNEAVQQDRRSVCNKQTRVSCPSVSNRKTRVSCPSVSATERPGSVALLCLQQKDQGLLPFCVCNRKTRVGCPSVCATERPGSVALLCLQQKDQG
jgi:hypothetical protein